MNRYIDADTLYVNVKAECNPYGKPTISFDDGCKVLDMIRRAPTSVVAPISHAHWRWMPNYDVICTKCQYVLPSGSPVSDFRFCPYCGAKMDEEMSK